MLKKLAGAALKSHLAKRRGRRTEMPGIVGLVAQWKERLDKEFPVDEPMKIGDSVVLQFPKAESLDGRVPWDGEVRLDENFEAVEESADVESIVTHGVENLDAAVMEAEEAEEVSTTTKSRCVVFSDGLALDPLMWAELHEETETAEKNMVDKQAFEAGLQAMLKADEVYEEIAELRKRRVDELIDLAVCGSRREAMLRNHLRVLHVEGCSNIDEGQAKIMARVLKSVRRQKQKLMAKAIAKQNRRRAQALKRTVGNDERISRIVVRSKVVEDYLQTSRDLEEAEEELAEAQKRYEQAFAAHEQAAQQVQRLKGSPANIPAARQWVEANYPTPEEQSAAYRQWYEEGLYHEYRPRWIA